MWLVNHEKNCLSKTIRKFKKKCIRSAKAYKNSCDKPEDSCIFVQWKTLDPFDIWLFLSVDSPVEKTPSGRWIRDVRQHLDTSDDPSTWRRLGDVRKKFNCFSVNCKKFERKWLLTSGQRLSINQLRKY